MTFKCRNCSHDSEMYKSRHIIADFFFDGVILIHFGVISDHFQYFTTKIMIYTD